MLTSLLRCRACRLTWFPRGGNGAACPACAGTEIGGTLELFHIGIALIVLGLTGWLFREGPLAERAGSAAPTVIEARQQTVVKEDRRVPAKERRVDQVTSKKVKKRQKAKKRSRHVQR